VASRNFKITYVASSGDLHYISIRQLHSKVMFIFIKLRFNFAGSKLLGMRPAQLVVLLLKLEHSCEVEVT